MMSSRAAKATGTHRAHSPAALALGLVGDVRHLGLVSRTASTLTDFAARVVTHVQAQNDGVVLEEYSGREFLPLISRLNQAVAPHVLAPDPAKAAPRPIHICLIHQADKLSAEQQSLICRLIALFPALPFRLIWLSGHALHACKSDATVGSIVVDLDADAATRQSLAAGPSLAVGARGGQNLHQP